MRRKWLTVMFEDGTKWVQDLKDDGTGELVIPAGRRVVRIAITNTRDTRIASTLAEQLRFV